MNAGTDYMLSVSLKYFPGISNLHFINNLRTGNSHFIEESIMNYEYLYDMLCEKAYLRFRNFYARSTKIRIIKGIIYAETDFKYLEAHHKIPKSDGGNDDLSNIVFFTPKEHIVAHHLLYKASPTQAHAQAWHCQAHAPKSGKMIRLTAQQFDELRKINAENARRIVAKSNETMRKSGQRFGSGNSMYGRQWYTNGETNICLTASDKIPEGFYRGRLNVVPAEQHKGTLGLHYYNNGKINKMFKTEDEIPQGFQKGMIHKCKK